MNLEIKTLTKLESWIAVMHQARQEAEKERQIILDATIGWRDYCRQAGISRPTLIKRRNEGLINFVMLGAEYRYFTPNKGGCNG